MGFNVNLGDKFGKRVTGSSNAGPEITATSTRGGFRITASALKVMDLSDGDRVGMVPGTNPDTGAQVIFVHKTEAEKCTAKIKVQDSGAGTFSNGNFWDEIRANANEAGAEGSEPSPSNSTHVITYGLASEDEEDAVVVDEESGMTFFRLVYLKSTEKIVRGEKDEAEDFSGDDNDTDLSDGE